MFIGVNSQVGRAGFIIHTVMLGFHDPGTDGLTSHPMKTGSYAMVLVRSIRGCVLMAALIALSPQVLALESLIV